MSVQAIRLRNFRGFRDATIELKPLTVLVGPNSSGKSAFGQALAAMAHAHDIYRGISGASLTPRDSSDAERWPVDLGETHNLRTHGAEGPVHIALETSGGWVDLGFGLDPRLPDLRLSYIAHPTGEDISSAKRAHVRRKIESVSEARSEVALGELGGLRNVQQAPEAHRIEVTRINENQWREGKTPVGVVLDGLLVKTVLHEGGTALVLGGKARRDIRFLLDHLTYLRPTRERAMRAYEHGKSRQHQAIGYGGEWTASILLDRASDRVRFADPPRVPDVTSGSRKIDYSWKLKRAELRKAVDTWLFKLDLATRVKSLRPRGDRRRLQVSVTLSGQHPHDLTEVGSGVSQVIPVLVAGLIQPRRSLFIVDLPDGHLHPRAQAALADFFCSLALSGRCSLVETHSEIFFHRLRLRAEMNPRLMRETALYFIDKPKDGVCCQPRRVGLSFEEELGWPVGFFQEGWETEVQIGSVRRAQKKGPR